MAGGDFQVSITGRVTGFDVGPINAFATSLTKIPTAANQVSSAGNNMAGSLQKTGTAATGVVSPVNQMSNSVTTSAKSFQTTGQSATGLVNPLTQLKTQTTATGQGFQATGALANAFGQNLSTTGNSANQLVVPLTNVKTRTGETGTQFQATGALTRAFGADVEGAGTQAGTFTGALDNLNTQGLTPTQGGLTTTNTLIEDSGTKTEEASGKFSNWSTVLVGGVASITNVATSIFGLISSYERMENAQIKAETADKKLQSANLALENAHKNLTLAITKYGEGSAQAQQAAEKLSIAEQGAGIAADRAQQAHDKLNLTVAEFYTDLVPNVIQVVSSLVTTITFFKQALDTANDSAGAAGDGMGILDKAVGGVSLRFITIAGPIIAAIALFALIETNTFGLGDAFRSTTGVIGTAIGTIVDGFFTMRNAFVGLANQIEAGRASMSNAFIGMHDALANAINQMVSAVRVFVADFMRVMGEIYNFFVKSVVNPVILAWNGMMKGITTAVNQVIGPLKAAFASAFSGIVSAAELLVGNLNNAFKTLGNKSLEPLAQALAKAKTEMENAGKAGKDSAGTIDTSFGQVKTIEPLTIKTVDLGTTTLGLIDKYENVNSALHAYDDELVATNGTTGTAITNTLNFASHGKNLANVFKTEIAPGLSQALTNVKEFTTGMLGAIFPTDNLGKASEDTSAKVKQQGDALARAKLEAKQHASALEKLTEEVNNTTAAMENGSFATDAAAKGHLELTKDISQSIEKSIELNSQTEDLSTTIGRTTQQLAGYAEGYTKAANDMAKLTGENFKALGALNATNAALGSQRGILDQLDAGFLEGAKAAQTWWTEQLKASETANGFYLELTKLDPQLANEIPNAAKLSTEQLKLMVGVLKGFPDAIKEVNDWFNKLVDAVGNQLADAAGKGHKEFKKALKDIEKDLGDFKLPKDQVWKLEAQSNFDDFIHNKVPEFIGLLGSLLKSGVSKIDLQQDIDKVMSGMREDMDKWPPQMRASADAIFADIKNVFAQDPGTPGWNNALATLKTALEQAGVPAAQVAQIMTKVSGGLANVAPAADSAINPLNDFNGAMNQSQQFGLTWIGILKDIAIAFNLAFGRGIDDAIGLLNNLAAAATVTFTNMITALAQVAQGINDAFARGVADAQGALTNLETIAASTFTNIITALAQVAAGFNQAFQRGTNDAAGYMNALLVNAKANLGAIIVAVDAIAPAFTKSFNTGAQNAAGSMNALAKNVQGNVVNMISATTAFASAITRNFNTGAQNAAGSMNALTKNVTSNSSTMISHINAVASAMQKIGSAAASARSQVQSLISSINSIPTNKTVTINIIRHETVVRKVVAAPGTLTTAAGTQAATTTVLPAIGGGTRKVTVEVKEPTVIKVDGRELVKLINRKIMELDLGALA